MKIKMICPECGKEFYLFPSRVKQGIKRCSRKCQAAHMTGKNNHEYKRGYQINTWGYKMIWADGKKVYEHRRVMEQHIGRKLLPGEEVHHINGNKLDNRIENLMILTTEEHKRLHTDKKTGRYVSRIDNNEKILEEIMDDREQKAKGE